MAIYLAYGRFRFVHRCELFRFKKRDYFTQCACAVISLVENRNRFFHHTTLTGFGYAIFVFFFSRFIVAIGENYLNSLYILTRIQNILTFNCCSMHLIWLSCCCSCDVLFIVRCWMGFCRLWMHFDNFNWCYCQKKNPAPTKTTTKYVTTRSKFKWKTKRGRKKLLKASMRGKMPKLLMLMPLVFFVVVVKCV